MIKAVRHTGTACGTLVPSEIRRSFFTAAVVFLFVSLTGSDAFADKLLLRIRAGNPLTNRVQKVQVKSDLPGSVTSTNDVLNLAGLNLSYDVRRKLYYVHKEVELGPREVREFNVEIRDIWQIPEAEIAGLGAQSERLVSMLKGRSYEAEALALRDGIVKSAGIIQQNQAKAALRTGTPPIRHIGVFEANLEVLALARKDLGRLENLVLATGQDPKQFLGQSSETPKLNKEIVLDPAQYKSAVYRITVRNSSATLPRKMTLKKELPPEIRIQDVINAGELEVLADPQTGVCSLYRKDVELAPGESKVFSVTLRDKWDVNRHRIGPLRLRATNLLERIVNKEHFLSVQTALRGLMGELDGVDREPSPKSLGPEYVSFFRGQAARLDEIEQKIARFEDALRPVDTTTKLGFRIRPPSIKTTWLIIYIILGFLALISLLFFLRWFGKTKEEQLSSAPGDSEGGTAS